MIVRSAITRHVCIAVSLQSTSLLLVLPISAHGTSEICWFYWLQNTRLLHAVTNWRFDRRDIFRIASPSAKYHQPVVADMFVIGRITFH